MPLTWKIVPDIHPISGIISNHHRAYFGDLEILIKDVGAARKNEKKRYSCIKITTIQNSITLREFNIPNPLAWMDINAAKNKAVEMIREIIGQRQDNINNMLRNLN